MGNGVALAFALSAIFVTSMASIPWPVASAPVAAVAWMSLAMIAHAGALADLRCADSCDAILLASAIPLAIVATFHRGDVDPVAFSPPWMVAAVQAPVAILWYATFLRRSGIVGALGWALGAFALGAMFAFLSAQALVPIAAALARMLDASAGVAAERTLTAMGWWAGQLASGTLLAFSSGTASPYRFFRG